MFGEYVTVTRSSNQTLDCVGNLTTRTYKEVEVLEDSNIDSPPRIGEIGLLIEVHNNEFVWIGRLKQFESLLSPNEVRIHPKRATGILFSGNEQNLGNQKVQMYRSDTVESTGKSPSEVFNYKIAQLVEIEETGDIVLRQQNSMSETMKAEIRIKPDETIEIKNTNITIILSPTGTINITASSTVSLTAPLINLN